MCMAITGTGTEQDPFIVHSYDEIKEAVESHPTTASTPYYSRLVNDIDCNSYGVDWEWETIELSSNRSGGSHCDVLDLYGHTIKNVFIKDGNRLFTGTNTAYPAGVMNGKIINVFGSTPNKACENITLNNVSISLEFSSVGGYVFNNCIITNCAIYAIILHPNSNNPSLIFYSGQGTNVKNVDIYAEIYNCASTGGAILHSSASNAYTDSIRIIGKLTPANPSSPPKTKIATYKSLNSVIDVDMSAYSFEGGSGVADIVGGNANNTTVINTDTLDPNGYTVPSGYIIATSSQIKVGSELRGLGFLVVNVEG